MDKIMDDDVKEPLLRMQAYYYGFDKTGVSEIDTLLAAVACAGKAYHHTENWEEESHKIDSYLVGETPVEWMQSAAIVAAEALTRLSEANAQLKQDTADIAQYKPQEIDAELAAKDARIEKLSSALKGLCFYGMEVSGVEDANKTQAIWEIVYRDRFSDWVDFEDLNNARQALSEGET